MTTGAPLYLVSACSSGDEFVAAFRRYVDRNGVVFVPMAAPLAPGARGRFAITLTDGGVMLEGEGEVVSASKSPSVLHGRVGMTLRFEAPDAPSKVLLGELEKARLSLRPGPSTVSPRPAEVPRAPRPTPPATGGRIDATNSLAECVAVGEPLEPSRLAAATPGRLAAAAPGRPVAATFKHSSQPVVAPTPDADADKRPSTMVGVAPAQSTRATAAAAAGTARAAAAIAAEHARTPPPTRGAAAPATPRPGPPVAPPVFVGPPRVSLPVEVASEHTDVSAMPPVAPDPREPRRTSLGIPIAASGEFTMPALGSTDEPATAPTEDKAAPMAGREVTHDTSVMNVPEVPDLRVDAPAPAPEAPPPPRTVTPPVLATPTRPPHPLKGAAVEEPTPSGDWTMTIGANGPTIAPRVPVRAAPKGPPTGDWMIALDPSTPDGWGEPSKVGPPPPGVLPPGPPQLVVASTRTLDSSRPPTHAEMVTADGPTVQVDPTLVGLGVDAGDTNTSVADAEEPALTAPGAATDDTAPARAVDMIDMEEDDDDDDDDVSAVTATGEVDDDLPPARPVRVTAPVGSGRYVKAPPAARAIPALGASPNAASARPSQAPGLGFAATMPATILPAPALTIAPGGPTLAPPRTAGGGRRALMVGLAAVLAIGAGAAAVLLFGGEPAGERRPQPTALTTQDAALASVPPLDASAEPTLDASAEPALVSDASVPAPPDATAAVAPADEAPAPVVVTPPVRAPRPPRPRAAAACDVRVTSTPTGADVVVGARTVGRTPATISLPCGKATRVTLRKASYGALTRVTTPVAGRSNQVTAALVQARARASVLVTVRSTPPGARIVLAGKTLGVTPSSVTLPAGAPVTLRLTKDGFAAASPQITPTTGLKVNVTLQKAKRAR